MELEYIYHVLIDVRREEDSGRSWLPLHGLGFLRSLSQLRLRNVIIGQDTVKVISLGCKLLQGLAIIRCGIRDADVSELHRCTNLRMLDLSSNNGLKDFSVIQILPHLPQLQELWLCSVSINSSSPHARRN